MVELCCQPNRSATSTRLAESVNTHPSFVRRIVVKLAKANLVRTTTGKSGTVYVERDPNSLSLRDIYKAMEGPQAFSVRHYAHQGSSVVSCLIRGILQKTLIKPQNAMEASLAYISLAQIVDKVTASRVTIAVIPLADRTSPEPGSNH